MTSSAAAPALGLREIVATLCVAVGAGVVPALQPILLGAMMDAGRLTGEQLGQAATMEGVGMAVGTTFSSVFLRPRRLRLIVALALLMPITAGLLTLVSSGQTLVWVRALNGTGNGVILWVLVGMMTRAPNPTRIFAIFVTSQAATTSSLSWLLSHHVLPSFGVNHAYGLLMSISIMMLAVTPFVPKAFAEMAGGRKALMLPTARGWVALFGVGAQIAAIMAFWVYAVPSAREAGIPQDMANRLVSTGNLALIAAGLAACALASRLSPFTAVVGTALLSMGVLVLTQCTGEPWLWRLALLAFVFCWGFAPPFHIGLLLRADPSGRTALFISPAQLMGLSAGPAIVSALIVPLGFQAAILVSFAGFAIALAVACLIRVASAGEAEAIRVTASSE